MSEVWAGMATLTERASIRSLATTSLLAQVDRLTIVNGDDRGDQVKFLACADAPDDAIFVGVDDDLIYPPDYVKQIVAGLDRHPGCIVSFHGWTMDRDEDGLLELHSRNFRCLETVVDDEPVHVVGSGVCAFSLNTIRPVLGDFKSRNAADLWLALRAQNLGVPRVVLAHESYWLGYCQMPTGRTVYRHTAYETGTSLDGSDGRNRAIGELAKLVCPERRPVEATA